MYSRLFLVMNVHIILVQSACILQDIIVITFSLFKF